MPLNKETKPDQLIIDPVGRIHQLHLCRGVKLPGTAQSAAVAEYTNASLQRGKTPYNDYPEYDTKQTDDEAPLMLELWRMQGTALLPSLLGPF